MAISGSTTIDFAASVKSDGSTTSRLLPERWAEVVNVKDFGAPGDGVGDDTAGINAAILHVIDNILGGAIVFFPPGKYRTSGTIKVLGGPVTGSPSITGRIHLLGTGSFWQPEVTDPELPAMFVCGQVGGSEAVFTLTGVTGTFQAAETVTGGTSGATATVAFWHATPGKLSITGVTGTFECNETLTGGTSGATGTISALGKGDFTSSGRSVNFVMEGFNVVPSPSAGHGIVFNAHIVNCDIRNFDQKNTLIPTSSWDFDASGRANFSDIIGTPDNSGAAFMDDLNSGPLKDELACAVIAGGYRAEIDHCGFSGDQQDACLMSNASGASYSRFGQQLDAGLILATSGGVRNCYFSDLQGSLVEYPNASGTYYVCIQSHVKSDLAGNPSTETAYWKVIVPNTPADLNPTQWTDDPSTTSYIQSSRDSTLVIYAGIFDVTGCTWEANAPDARANVSIGGHSGQVQTNPVRGQFSGNHLENTPSHLDTTEIEPLLKFYPPADAICVSNNFFRVTGSSGVPKRGHSLMMANAAQDDWPNNITYENNDWEQMRDTSRYLYGYDLGIEYQTDGIARVYTFHGSTTYRPFYALRHNDWELVPVRFESSFTGVSTTPALLGPADGSGLLGITGDGAFYYVIGSELVMDMRLPRQTSGGSTSMSGTTSSGTTPSKLIDTSATFITSGFDPNEHYIEIGSEQRYLFAKEVLSETEITLWPSHNLESGLSYNVIVYQGLILEPLIRGDNLGRLTMSVTAGIGTIPATAHGLIATDPWRDVVLLEDPDGVSELDAAKAERLGGVFVNTVVDANNFTVDLTSTTPANGNYAVWVYKAKPSGRVTARTTPRDSSARTGRGRAWAFTNPSLTAIDHTSYPDQVFPDRCIAAVPTLGAVLRPKLAANTTAPSGTYNVSMTVWYNVPKMGKFQT